MLLEIEGLTKTFRRGVRGDGVIRANDGISLTLAAGEVFGLLGHNGAGKTTLVNQVVGLLKPDSGTIRLDGRDVVADPGFGRRACSVQAQAQVPMNGLTPRQAIELIGRLRGGSSADVRVRADRLIDELQLGEWLGQDGATLFGGVKRLVSFCMAAVTPGKLVMLDEPTNDVDPVRRRLLWAQVRRLATEGSAVLLVTHNVVEAERSVDRLAILDEGRSIVEGTPASLKASVADELGGHRPHTGNGRAGCAAVRDTVRGGRPPGAALAVCLGRRGCGRVGIVPAAGRGHRAVRARAGHPRGRLYRDRRQGGRPAQRGGEP